MLEQLRSKIYVQSLYQNLSVLQVFLDDTTKETKDIETHNFIEKRIRDVIYKTEDKVDSSLRNNILADCGEKREVATKFFEEELLKVEKDVDSLRKEMMVVEFNKHGSKSAELATTPYSPEKSIIEENTVVGKEDDFNTILDRLTSQIDELTVIRIFGMDGIGKTTLAKKVYDDSYICSRFDKHAWVTIFEEYNQRQRANGRMRSCKIHDLLRQMCLSEAHTENVLHVMNGDALKAIDDQRRVILVSNVEEKHDYCLRHNSGIIRTFISMDVAFPKGMCLQLKLLKVLDVLSIEYDFSSVIPELVHLRYVAVRIKEAVSLAKLRNLQTIILRREIIFKSRRKSPKLILPLDIWTMSEIRQVDIGFPLYISNPLVGEQPLFLNNLQMLYLCHTPFVAEIIRRSPNLKKLKILDDSEHPDWPAILDSLSLLQDMETLHIETKKNIDSMIISGAIFLPNLNKLTLTRTHKPWEVVNLLANLPNLEVLKGYRAFAGTDWKIDEDVVFHKLKYLQLYGPYDLERWEAAVGSDNFPMLQKLLLHWFIQLEEIQKSIGDIMSHRLFIYLVEISEKDLKYIRTLTEIVVTI